MTLELLLSILSLATTVGGGIGVVLVTRSRVDRVETDISDLKAEKASKESVEALRQLLASGKAEIIEAMRREIELLRREIEASVALGEHRRRD